MRRCLRRDWRHSPSGAGKWSSWLAALSLPLGFTQAKEYAELEWPIDILITLVWVSYAVVFFGTIVKRTVSHIYVANWFFGGFILTVAVLHLVNSAAIPVFSAGVLTPKSYSAYAGVQDAMIQWWYGHNAVGFFLTAGFLGMMYYFVPKQAGRPVYSYRLSVVHFWALIFTYMWAGPHHLHYTALPDWTQSGRHGLLADPAGTFLGRHDQRHHDACRAPGTNCATTRS
jgi:cytochrome c oxidase cbb3-type subunit 1